jgi:lipoate-protein ligase A
MTEKEPRVLTKEELEEAEKLGGAEPEEFEKEKTPSSADQNGHWLRSHSQDWTYNHEAVDKLAEAKLEELRKKLKEPPIPPMSEEEAEARKKAGTLYQTNTHHH